MSARRSLQIMRQIAGRDKAISVTELAENLAIPIASVYRLVSALENEDVLQRSRETGGLELSASFLRSMIAGASDEQIISGFEEALVCTAKTWGATAFLGRLNGSIIDIVHVVVPPNSKKGFVHPGINVRPANSCSAARAIFSFLPRQKATKILDHSYPTFTDKTIVDEEDLQRELLHTNARGYAICDEEIDTGITSIAAPILVGKAGVMCSMGIVSFSKTVHELGIDSIGEYLKSKARGAVINLNQNIFEALG